MTVNSVQEQRLKATNHSRQEKMPSSRISVFFLVALFAQTIQGIRVLTSVVKLEEEGTKISGARLLDDRNVSVKEAAFCMRFNYKLLGGWEERSQLIHIEDWRTGPKVSTV